MLQRNNIWAQMISWLTNLTSWLAISQLLRRDELGRRWRTYENIKNKFYLSFLLNEIIHTMCVNQSFCIIVDWIIRISKIYNFIIAGQINIVKSRPHDITHQWDWLKSGPRLCATSYSFDHIYVSPIMFAYSFIYKHLDYKKLDDILSSQPWKRWSDEIL